MNSIKESIKSRRLIAIEANKAAKTGHVFTAISMFILLLVTISMHEFWLAVPVLFIFLASIWLHTETRKTIKELENEDY